VKVGLVGTGAGRLVHRGCDSE